MTARGRADCDVHAASATSTYHPSAAHSNRDQGADRAEVRPAGVFGSRRGAAELLAVLASRSRDCSRPESIWSAPARRKPRHPAAAAAPRRGPRDVTCPATAGKLLTCSAQPRTLRSLTLRLGPPPPLSVDRGRPELRLLHVVRHSGCAGRYTRRSVGKARLLLRNRTGLSSRTQIRSPLRASLPSAPVGGH